LGFNSNGEGNDKKEKAHFFHGKALSANDNV
jgi:hypothetical protein